jgi:perosamine synthetase
MFAAEVDEVAFGCTRDELMSELTKEGIETRPIFIPLHTLPPFREGSRRRNEHLPVTDQLGARGIMLPTYNTLTLGDQERVVSAIAATGLRARQTRRRAA